LKFIAKTRPTNRHIIFQNIQLGHIIHKCKKCSGAFLILLKCSAEINVEQKLQDPRFDVLLTDPIFPCVDLLAKVLNIPFVNTVCFFLAIHKGCTVKDSHSLLLICLLFSPN
jgi:hypothetical protein